MQIIESAPELRAALATKRGVAVVPTMGNLHEGHLQLMQIARANAKCTVATIFVNRLQFGPNEDFNRYPRTFESDCAQLRNAGVDFVFAPPEEALYPVPQVFKVDPPPALADILEGEFRPGFFRGVATVVLKLFSIVRPDLAVFGKKDFQQLLIVRGMVEQFALPIRIIAGETARAPDGLALSSRNGYLSVAERGVAPELNQSLRAIRDAAAQGDRNWSQLESAAATTLAGHGWRVDYISVRRRGELLPPGPSDRQLVALAAARIGATRLIDNIEFDAPLP